MMYIFEKSDIAKCEISDVIYRRIHLIAADGVYTPLCNQHSMSTQCEVLTDGGL
jgi:hypothetical protein